MDKNTIHTAAPVIALDGFAATGKTAVATALAKKLGWRVLFSGMLYRYVAFSAARDSLGEYLDHIPPSWHAALSDIDCTMHNDVLDVRVNGESLGAQLTQESVGVFASKIAKNLNLRAELLSIQRSYRGFPGLIAEGRDMGSVVFPDAKLKVFLRASEDIRAQRRYDQLKRLGKSAIIHDILSSIKQRDARDLARITASSSENVKVIDTSTMTVDAVVSLIYRDL